MYGEGAEISFDNILDRVTGSDPSVTSTYADDYDYVPRNNSGGGEVMEQFEQESETLSDETLEEHRIMTIAAQFFFTGWDAHDSLDL